MHDDGCSADLEIKAKTKRRVNFFLKGKRHSATNCLFLLMDEAGMHLQYRLLDISKECKKAKHLKRKKKRNTARRKSDKPLSEFTPYVINTNPAAVLASAPGS